MSLNVVRYNANAHEKGLIDDIEEIGYGELFDIDSPKGIQEQIFPVQIPQSVKDFLAALRMTKGANKLVIHDGLPAILEIYTRTQNGRRCLKKIKLS